MAQGINPQLVQKVAHLARLDLSDSELEEFTAQLRSIIEYVEKINQLDTEGVEPLAHCLPVTNCFREDEARDSLEVEQALANAPMRDDAFFRVPKILDQDGGT
jgi:aspartyl-tRNA(Asn)/glutamyl-tRNA(Gln) amidotransferase subunit C